jgi:hypothetical protein
MEELEHSNLGIASFVFGLSSVVLLAINLAFDIGLPELFFFSATLSVIGLIAGSIALCIPSRKKIFVVWGLILSACPLVLALLFIIAISNMDFGGIR